MNHNYSERDAIHWASLLLGIIIIIGTFATVWYTGIGLANLIQAITP